MTDEFWANRITVWFGWLVLGVLTALAVGSSCGCAPARYPGADVTGASVVLLVRPERLTDEDGVPVRVAFVGACSAFAVERSGQTVLATAKHCTGNAGLGAWVRYVEPNGVGYGMARLVWYDLAYDQALLSVDDDQLVPLEQVRPPGAGAHVTAVSAYYEGVSAGTVLGPIGAGYYQTTQTIIFGWSGSPVLDDTGRVWGIVSKCPLASDPVEAQAAGVGVGTCLPGATIVAGLP